MKLEDIARESRATHKGDKSGVPIVGLEHLIPQEIKFSGYDVDTENTFTKAFKKGQILFGRRRAYLKKAAIADFDGICSGDITVIEAIPGKVDPLLLPFIIQNDKFFDYAVSRSAGGLSPRVKWEHLKDYEFDLPSIDEQRILADKLWAAYRLKESYKKLLTATQEMVKSQFIEMFGGETNKVPLEEIVIVKDDCRKPINEGVRSEMKDGELYPYYGATGVVDYINDYLTDDELLCIAEDCGNYNAGEESAYIIRGKAWVNNHAHLVKTKETCDIKYLYYFLKIADLKPYVSGTTRLKLTQKKLKEISVTLPSINMQKSFVEIAEQADKSEFVGFKSQFIEMFGDPMTNSKEWIEYGKINQYAQIVLGSTPNSKEASYWDGDIKWITPAEMTEESYYIYDTDRHITEDGVKSASLTLLPYRSVLFSTRAPIGKVGLVGSPMYCNQGFKNFICGDKLNPVYLYYTLIYKREYLVSLGTGTTFKELSKRTVEGLDIAIPPLSLQEQFENIYHQADKSEYYN